MSPVMVGGPVLWYSKAVRRPMPYVDQLPDLVVGRPTLIGHTNGGGSANGSLFGWFSRGWEPTSNVPIADRNTICSHFQIFWDGTVEQYVPLNKQAYAQFSGNAFAWSVEHQDDGDNMRPLSPAQLASFMDLRAELGVPLALAPADGPGVGWHSLHHDEWNRSNHDCPGPVREAQFRGLLSVVAPAQPPVPAPPVTGMEVDVIYVIEAPNRSPGFFTSDGVIHPMGRNGWTFINRFAKKHPGTVVFDNSWTTVEYDLVVRSA